jgi:hypothetical protein
MQFVYIETRRKTQCMQSGVNAIKRTGDYNGGPKGGTNHAITIKICQNHASRLDIWIFHVSRLSAWVDYRLLSVTSWCQLYMLKTLL